MLEMLERNQDTTQNMQHVQALFLDKTQVRLEAMCDNFDSGLWTTAIKKSLVSNAFSIKNESITLGYRLLAKVAESFCAYADSLKYPDESQRLTLQKHLETMQSIVLHDVQGEGSTTAQSLYAHLQLLTEKFKAQ
jgi:hypothetical protein